MGQGNHATTLQQRLEISDRAARGETDPQIAAALQLSPATVRKWRRRGQREGRSGLGSHMGRPRTGALGQTSLEVRDAARELRLAHPGWGHKPYGSSWRTIGGLAACASPVAPDWPRFSRSRS